MKIGLQTQCAVATAARQYTSQRQQVMRNAGIDLHAWCNMLFELGCQFVETHVEETDTQNGLLTQAGWGFWDWWLWQWMEHDRRIMHHRTGDAERYYRQKKAMLQDAEVYKQFLQLSQKQGRYETEKL